MLFDSDQLLMFAGAVVVLVIVPGPNTMIILAHSLGGRKSGFATVAGVEFGTLIHTLATAIGLAALITTSVTAFTIIKYAGAAYLLITAARLLLQPPALATTSSAPSPLVAFRRALVTNVLNPKSIVFFLAFLPQFVRPERGHLFAQFIVLGLLVSAIGSCIGSLNVLVAASLSQWLMSHSGFARWQSRVTAIVLIAIALGVLFAR